MMATDWLPVAPRVLSALAQMGCASSEAGSWVMIPGCESDAMSGLEWGS